MRPPGSSLCATDGRIYALQRCFPRHFGQIPDEVTRVVGTVYIIEGAGGNIDARAGEDGVLMVADEVQPLVGRHLRGLIDQDA